MEGEHPNVLKALDSAKTQLHHFTTIMIAGMGFFTDAYDLFCISLITKLLGRIYYTDNTRNGPGNLPANVAATVNGVALCGTLAGQLFFGWLSEKLGRKSVDRFTLILMGVCSLTSGLSFGHTANDVIGTLCFFRFWLGFGIGGNYVNKKNRCAFITAVFAMQGFGILFTTILTIIVSAVFRQAFPAPPFYVDAGASIGPEADYVWRIIVMFGTIPAVLTYYWRMKLPVGPRYTALIAHDMKQATTDMSRVLNKEITEEQVHCQVAPGNTWGLFSRQFMKRHGLHLLATTGTWFLLDVSFYSQNLFQADIFSKMGWLPPPRSMSALEEVYRIARVQALIALCGTVPGYWFTVAFINIIGRFWIQISGFTMMTIFMLAVAVPYDYLVKPANHTGFIVLYGLTFFFANFGPNSTTLIVPGEIFPMRFRTTCHGISAASGKAGAIIGVFGFLYVSQDQEKPESGYAKGIGMRNSLFVFAGSNFLGLLFSLLVPDSMGRSLEKITKENVDGDETKA